MLESVQPQTSVSTPVRGAHRLWDPRVWGTIVGAAGATVFVLANRGALAPPWPTVAAFTWAGVFLAYVWFVFGAPRVFGEMAPAGLRAGVTYLGSVVGMLVLIRLGAVLLDDVGSVGLRPPLIVVAVGLHFLPFAKAFHPDVCGPRVSHDGAWRRRAGVGLVVGRAGRGSVGRGDRDRDAGHHRSRGSAPNGRRG